MKKLKIFSLMFSFGLEVFCSQIVFIYIPLMIIISGDGELLAAVTRALAYIGPVLFGFYIGSIIDKTNKRISGFLVAFIIAFLTAVFGFFSLFNNIFATVAYLFFASVTTYFLNNLRVTALPVLIKKSQLSKANSFLLVTENVALLVAPVISSLMIKFSLPSNGIGLLSFCFLLSAFLYLFSLKGYQTPFSTRNHSGFWDSCRVLFSNKQLVVFVLAMMGSNAFVGVFSLYIMIHAFDSGIFTHDEAPFILIASGIGAIISGVLATKVINLLGANKLVIICGLSLAICGILPLFVNHKAAFYLSSFGEGFFSSWLVICVWTMRQTSVPKNILGKVTGITSALFKLSMVVSIPLSGWIAVHFGSSFSLISASLWVSVFILPIVFYSRNVALQKIDLVEENRM